MGGERTEIQSGELENQRKIMARVRARGGSAPRRAHVATFGCQQNESDSERLRGMLLEMGYSLTDSIAEADVIVLNTCAVREHAEAKVFGVVGALTHKKRESPDAVIAVCGCMAQRRDVADRIKNSYKHVELVFGTHALWRFPELLEGVLDTRERVFSVDASPGAIAEGLPLARDGSYKAWLSVMYGCDNFCAYCIVPYVRGRERSRRPEMILADARRLVSEGYKDITLLGQNVNSYGRGLDESIDFPDLLRRLNGIDGEFLLRFMTSHPKDAGEQLFAAMASCEKVARHIHLPFQAGSDRVLRAMNRGYTRARYLELTDMARRAMPGIVLTSDVIVGFPGETEADFEDTLRLIEEARFDALFTFLYSKRPGTPAAELPDGASREEKQRRFDRLLALQNAISGEKHAAYLGKTLRVLADTETGDAEYPVSGRTNGNRLVRLRGGELGAFADVKITGGGTWSLTGEVI
ncbi:MAG: tRNA (N6-isopentenyl adenosine(37)-C2)-methylthiotransferase MiaB [Oscillospiraceae bacterium]|nr:tRNA (N6-isopentenyl adenosine(37)-C2)-methylthiotransferase MiaB [Oscillospiraceae bacterium]